MAERVVVIRVEDHVSPVLKAIDDMRLTIPAYATLPELPEDLVNVTTAELTSTVSVIMRPSPAILGWLADVRHLSTLL